MVCDYYVIPIFRSFVLYHLILVHTECIVDDIPFGLALIKKRFDKYYEKGKWKVEQVDPHTHTYNIHEIFVCVVFPTVLFHYIRQLAIFTLYKPYLVRFSDYIITIPFFSRAVSLKLDSFFCEKLMRVRKWWWWWDDDNKEISKSSSRFY